MFTIYHNPRCSKSRETLQLLQQHNVDIEVVEYLTQPLSAAQLTSLLAKLNVSAIDIMRTKEPEFKQQNLANADDQQLLAALVDTPKLMERPIVVHGDLACIGRPPENVLTLL
jgi:arsenate reductase (glutaredoxin)